LGLRYSLGASQINQMYFRENLSGVTQVSGLDIESKNAM